MLKMLNEGFDKKYKDNIVSKKNKKKIVEAVERPEEFAEFDDDMNPANYGIEEDLFDVLDDTAKGISDNINTITGKDSVLRDKNLGKNLTDIGDAVAEIKTGGMFKEGIEDNLGVFHNDNGNDYKVIERSKSGHNALLQRGNQWIIAWNCPESNEGSWGQGHYFFDEETARKAWEEKYLNECVQKLTEAPFVGDVLVDPSKVSSKIKPVSLDLLSKEEAEKLPKEIRRYSTWWWLRSPGINSYYATHVSSGGFIDDEGSDVYIGFDAIRPVLTVSNLDSSAVELYKEYLLFGTKWLYIGYNRFLYNDEPIKHRFDLKSNRYELSEIKSYLFDWLKQLQNKDVNESLNEDITDIEARKVWEEKYLNENINLKEDNFSDNISKKYKDKNVKLNMQSHYPEDYSLNKQDEQDMEFWEEMLKHEDLIGRIDSMEVYANNDPEHAFEDQYWNVIYDDGFRLEGISGYELELLKDAKEESLKESIKRIISSLNEAQMSPEDEADSKLLRGIYDKTQQRSNAKLTPEEKAVLDKYGLTRNTWNKNVNATYGDKNYMYMPLINKNETPGKPRTKYNKDSNKINYADRARKIKERGAGYARSLPYNPFNGISSDDHREWQDPKTGKWVRLNDKGLLDKERAAQNTTMTDKVVSMRQSLADRKYHGKKVADNDDEYNARRAQLEKEYQKKLADLEHNRQFSGKYHQDYLDKANKNIDKLLGREQKEESLKEQDNIKINELRDEIKQLEKSINSPKIRSDIKSEPYRDLADAKRNLATEQSKPLNERTVIHGDKEESCDKMKKAVAEDFDERNLERVGTAEYQANTKRQEHIDMYRKFANLLPDEEITEDNIDEWALTRTACLANREPARIKAEILGQRYSDYELR